MLSFAGAHKSECSHCPKRERVAECLFGGAEHWENLKRTISNPLSQFYVEIEHSETLLLTEIEAHFKFSVKLKQRVYKSVFNRCQFPRKIEINSPS